MSELNQKLVSQLEKRALVIRKNIIKMIEKSGQGHIGPALSIADLITALYFNVLRVNPKDPHWEERDRFILSKGHSCAALYAALAEAGFFPENTLDTFMQLDTNLAGHPDMRRVPGVEMSTGSLGHGLPVGIGIALSMRLDNRNCRIFVLMGDGENQEGSVWESAMAAAHYKLENLVAIVDRNRLEIDGSTESVMGLEPLREKWKSFGWQVKEIDGHNIEEIVEALKAVPILKGKPSVIIAHTIKGKGVSFMENKIEWHYRPLSKEEAEQALQELNSKV